MPVLDHIAAKSDIDDLMTAADTEDRLVFREEFADECDLIAVTVVINTGACGVFLSVEGGVYIGTAGYEECVAGVGFRKVHGKDGLYAAGSECIDVILIFTGIAAKKYFFHG